MVNGWNNDNIKELERNNLITNFTVYANSYDEELKLQKCLMRDNVVSQGFVDNLNFFQSNSPCDLSYISISRELKKFMQKSQYLINYISNSNNDIFSEINLFDGVIVTVDILEGVSPIHEKIIRESINNNIKPLLLINNIDKINFSNNFTPEKLQDLFLIHFMNFNRIIRQYTPDESFKVDFTEGSVSFGSIDDDWLMNVPTLRETGINFLDIINTYINGTSFELSYKIPFSKALIDMAWEHLLNTNKKSFIPFKDINYNSKLDLDQQDNSFKVNYCPNCGTKLQKEGNFCYNCGCPLH